MKKAIYTIGTVFMFVGIIIFTLKGVGKAEDFPIDKNNNGIWDDVEAKINKNYAGQSNRIKGYYQFAKVLQKTVTEFPMTKKRAVEIDDEMIGAINCLFSLSFEIGNDSLILEEWVVNSKERTKRYIKYNSLLSGEVSKHDSTGEQCDFKVEK